MTTRSAHRIHRNARSEAADVYFPPSRRHLPKRNTILPTGPQRDDTARREIARLVVLVEDLQREMRTQFTRIANLQAELDQMKRLLQKKHR